MNWMGSGSAYERGTSHGGALLDLEENIQLADLYAIHNLFTVLNSGLFLATVGHPTSAQSCIACVCCKTFFKS